VENRDFISRLKTQIDLPTANGKFRRDRERRRNLKGDSLRGKKKGKRPSFHDVVVRKGGQVENNNRKGRKEPGVLAYDGHQSKSRANNKKEERGTTVLPEGVAGSKPENRLMGGGWELKSHVF